MAPAALVGVRRAEAAYGFLSAQSLSLALLEINLAVDKKIKMRN